MNLFFSRVREAIYWEKQKEYTRAFNIFVEAESYTNNPSSQIKMKARRAWCLYAVGNPKETEAVFTEILAEHPSQAQSVTVYAKYLIRIKKFKKAQMLLKKGIQQFPSFLENYLLLASLLKDRERSEEAIGVLRLALSQENLTNGRGIHRTDIWAELGSLYFGRGDTNSSLVCLKRALSLVDESEFLHYDLLASCYLELEDSENAKTAITNHFKYHKEIDPESLILLARANCRLGELEEASRNLLQAYSMEDFLFLKADDFLDFAPLLRNGFFTTLENLEWEEP